LVFQIKHIGDFLQTLPALDFIREQTGRPADLVVAPKIADLARRHPWVDRLFVLDRNAGPGRRLRLLADLRRRGCGTAFIFDGQRRSITCAFLAGIPERVGASGLYGLGRLAALYTRDANPADARWPLASQAVRTLAAAAAALGRPPAVPRRPPPLKLEEADRNHARNLLASLPGDGPLIGLTLTGLQPEKSWPLAHFAELARRLWAECRARLFVTGGPGEGPAAAALARAAGAPIGDFCGRTNLAELTALAEGSDLFITVDTGTSHIVALTETPLISIFIWTSPAQWPPQTPHARLLAYDWALRRFGLSPADGPWRTAPVITPGLVFEEAMHLLAGRSV
jgi:heptosyltransferase-2